jgi:hypothetical protein
MSGCGCRKNTPSTNSGKQWEVWENGRRVFGPTPYESTARSVAGAPGHVREIREVQQGAR